MRLRGVGQVVRFNWPKLVAGASTVAGLGLAWRFLPRPVRLLAAPVGLGAGAWMLLSLVGSWWVYDRSPLRHWGFVTDHLPRPPRRVLLVVAGFDEVSGALARQLPDAEIDVVDVVTEPEPSVRRARAAYPADVPVRPPALLGGEGDYDVVLFAQSAHEIRDPRQRRTLFASARAALRPGGHVVLVEHLRDLPNLIVFGPGAFHFTRLATWRAAFATAGLRLVGRRDLTPLVHSWTLEPAP